ncbi:DUF6431 domain-containing protein [Paenibacillus arenilitoris]|uniref:DUF6431 domain-containing protein n=1 Tax=Paenibacillus arenilitoris TaxID=2772299 RepID=UPI001CC24143
MHVIGSRKRKIVNGGVDLHLLVIRRMRCSQCRKIHHELPDCVVPLCGTSQNAWYKFVF